MSQKRVYTFGNGLAEGKADMRNLLGGKGARPQGPEGGRGFRGGGGMPMMMGGFGGPR